MNDLQSRKSLFLWILLVCSFPVYAQVSKAVRITYCDFNNGEPVANSEQSFIYANQVAYLNGETDKIRNYIDFGVRENVSILRFDNQLFQAITSFDSLPKATIKDRPEKILGFACNYASFSYFSNTIEVWFTEDALAKGSIYSRYLPTPNALVLKIVVNGNRTIQATSIANVQTNEVLKFPKQEAKKITQAEFEELKIKSRYKTVVVFENETINFIGEAQPAIGDKYELYKTYHFSKGTVILKKIKLEDEIKKGDFVYANLSCSSLGDAYDRTGSVFIIPASNEQNSMLTAFEHGIEKLPVVNDNEGNEYQGFVMTETYAPPIEVMRFFTSFGAGHFNDKRIINNYNWANKAEYKQDITELIPEENEFWIGVFIGNYSKDGHQVSLELNFYPGFEGENDAQRILLPLFNTVNVMEMSGQNYPRLFNNDTLEVSFTLPDSVENVTLFYTTTGHGGWGGGDEFNPKLNQLFLDETKVFSVIPWRSDCATYRLLNPASGNFDNGMSSSDFSRSNWCPGTVTPPYRIELDNLSPGPHTVKVVIDQGENEGNNFSHWGVSGVLVGTIK